MTDLDLDAIARDLDLCALGIAMTRGRLKARYVAQRAAILEAIHDANVADGLDILTDDQLLAELSEAPDSP